MGRKWSKKIQSGRATHECIESLPYSQTERLLEYEAFLIFSWGAVLVSREIAVSFQKKQRILRMEITGRYPVCLGRIGSIMDIIVFHDFFAWARISGT